MQEPPLPRNFVAIADTAFAWRGYENFATIKKYKKNTAIFHAGDMVDSLYFIYCGEVRMEYYNPDGREKIILYMGENTLLGEVLFFLRKPCRGTFICTRATTIWGFSRDNVENTLLREDPQLADDIFYTLSLKSRLLNEHILTMTMDDVAARLCKYLHLNAKRNQQGILICHCKISKQDMANLLGIHRISLYKVIKNLETQGILKKIERNRVVIQNEEAFFALLERSSPLYPKEKP